ncbi:MAG TPA: endonuclease [Planctomycetaceae bacterium]|nr:endonuclease [Planctomycetaceae bacterium]
MRRILTLLLLAGCLSSAIADPIRAMSWNIRYFNLRDGIDAWPNRKDWAADLINRTKPDIIGLQEVVQRQMTDLKKGLKDYDAYGVGRDDGKTKGEYAPIFYRRDRFQVLEKSTFWLSKTPDKVGSRDWDAAITRIASWVRLKDRTSGQKLLFVNTHFDHRGSTARLESARLLRRRLQSTFADHDVILTGDFNAMPTAPPIVALTQKTKDEPRWFDARGLSKTKYTGPNSTWCGFRAVEPGRRIDYIFVTEGVEVIRHNTIDEQMNGRFPSDHLPVAAEVQLPKSN